MPRRRSFRRRPRRGRGNRRLRRFAARIARAGTEPKYWETNAFLEPLTQGDGTTPIVHIRNLPSNLIQGDGEDQFHGNQIFLKGVGIRVQAATFTDLQNFSTVYVRYTLIFSRQNATNMLGSGASYSSTTTDNTNPAQATPFANPRLFDVNATPGRFTGTGYETFWDRTNVKVKASRLIKINNGGAGSGIQLTKIYFRINKYHQYNNPDNSALTTAPNHGRFGSWYLITQIFTPDAVANPGAGANLGDISDNVRLYFRDP